MGTSLKKLEERLQQVEVTLAQLLTREKPTRADPRSPWYLELAGKYADDPVFDEIVKLGRKWRVAQRPKSGRRGRDHS